ncbi:EamA family transporter [Actinacidiphila yanglinensis]|uniref:EamA family transporter n=1 Tax=Actinacidiphila yanglinensis TaxID=310779 RepID=UPI002AFEFD7E|nr:EamA family transporter [Actinacidiphila yanglinensis]
MSLLVEGLPPATLSTRNMLGYGYLTLVGAALAYALWFRGIRELPPTNVTFLVLLSPVVATAVGWLALGQELTAMQVAGGVLILGALVAAQLKPAVEPLTAPPPLTGRPSGT